MANRPRISKPEDFKAIAGIIRRAIHETPAKIQLRPRLVAKLRETFDAEAIYEFAAIQMLDAKEFRAALVVLATISSENEAMLREWTKVHEELAQLFKNELRDRTTELIGLVRGASERGTQAINARHDKPGGYRELRARVQKAWASGKYKTKTACAMAAQKEIGISYDAALKALRTPRKKPAATA